MLAEVADMAELNSRIGIVGRIDRIGLAEWAEGFPQTLCMHRVSVAPGDQFNVALSNISVSRSPCYLA